MTPRTMRLHLLGTTLAAGALSLMGTMASADQQILDDLIVDGSACVGQDCVNGESFGFDTLRLKENNLRLHFDDTSTSASFPSNDWRLSANDSSNGGANRFSIEDATGGRTPFLLTAGAPTNSIHVDSQGDVGMGVANAVVELHVADGNSPTLRLEQNGTSGFTPQTWDLAGNEANFFIRDVTNGSKLPFKIKPGAPSNSLYVNSTGNVGIGTDSPVLPLHVRTTGSDAAIALQNGTSAANFNLNWASNDTFRMSVAGSGQQEFLMDASGNVTITGTLTTGGAGACSSTPCDAVFDPAVYTVPSIEDHAAFMWEKKHLPAVGPTSADQPVNMTEKMLRMLNELEHAHIFIQQLNDELKEQRAEIVELKQTLSVQ